MWSKMRNEILPLVSSTQLYNFGNSDIQFQNLDFSMQFDHQLNMSNARFCMDSIQVDQPLMASTHELSSYPPLVLLSNPRPETELSILKSTERKCPITDKTIETFPRGDLYDVIGNHVNITRSSDSTNKKRKNQQMLENENQRKLKQRVAVKRTQKLSDKITTLQQLVSPYGKTDTASVLQEASFYIKVLQKQIQVLNNCSYTYGEVGGEDPLLMVNRAMDLRSRGLCLVPVSAAIQKLRD